MGPFQGLGRGYSNVFTWSYVFVKFAEVRKPSIYDFIHKVKQVLDKCNLPMNNIRSQTYYNAAVMKGEDKGLQALIKKHQ